MEVILLERVEKLGQMGDVVKVKPGFARNFLLPQKKALRATEANKKRFENERAQLEAVNLKHRQEAEAMAAKMRDLKVMVIRQAGEAGQLYGSVTSRDVAEAVTAAGFTIERRQVRLDVPIKAIGIYTVRIVLHPEVTLDIGVNVARSEEEAEIQARTGKAVIHIEERKTETVPEVPEAAPTEADQGAGEAEAD
jgi:large subunit ribosomal protein L9